MIQGTCRLWNISISALVFLTVYNVMLTVKLMYSQECPKHQNLIEKPPRIVYQQCDKQKLDEHLLNLDLNLGRWDNRHKYKLFDNILVGDKYGVLNEVYKTCLATQSSLEKLLSITEVSNHWNGPISLAIFAASSEELNSLLLYITYLRRCDSKIKDRVSFHLALTEERRPKNFNIDLDKLEQFTCENPSEVLQHLMTELNRGGQNKWRSKLPYPQNHLRNLARKNCQTKYVFLTDVDIIPSKGMAESLDVFLDNTDCNGQCAYVVPTFELDARVHFPHNKTDLIRLVDKGLARPFHHKVFIYNQYATNFTRWQSNVNEGPDIHISHPVTNFEFLYEPFYISPDTVPAHDERFIGYGYTRNSQVYEMFVAGYEFLVLSPIFTCHWGLQVKRSRPPWREHQNNLNRKQFDGFKREIFAKYNKDPLNMMISRKT
ncbi:beta-1,4-glucuronyltransferase 1 [Leptinotarsa decemlineata]|uniref:beta-1,4-glucuronyltransferase 1 n=1 Tax=Leptinotarsa decemlineata TaxID=7539 RepID=UPI000C251F11|nr:beta-1,4-glucuronyltransferase 1 [Leptinotarsa decemlineata]